MFIECAKTLRFRQRRVWPVSPRPRFWHGRRARCDIALVIKSNMWPPITSGDIHPRLCRGRPKGTSTSAALVVKIDRRLTCPGLRFRLVDLSTLLAAWPRLPAPTSRPRQHLVDNGCFRRSIPTLLTPVLHVELISPSPMLTIRAHRRPLTGRPARDHVMDHLDRAASPQHVDVA